MHDFAIVLVQNTDFGTKAAYQGCAVLLSPSFLFRWRCGGWGYHIPAAPVHGVELIRKLGLQFGLIKVPALQSLIHYKTSPNRQYIKRMSLETAPDQHVLTASGP